MSMTPLRATALTLLLGSPLLAQAAPANDHGAADFYKAYYLENERGDLEAAHSIYASIAKDSRASDEVRKSAKSRAHAVWEELASSDFARLVPEETIVYLELNRPGEQLGRLLDQLGLLQGSDGSGDIAVSPLLVEGLLGVRGAAVAITHVDPTGGMPAGVGILHPGDMDIVRGLIETALPAGGQRVDSIGGHDTWLVEGMAFVTLTDRLVLVSLDRGHIEGVLKRLHGKGASLAENPDLDGVLSMRGEDLLFFCVNAEPIMPQITAMLGQMAQHEPEMAMAMSLLDIESTQAIAGRFGVDENGISLDVGLQLADDHQNVAFNLLRMPHVTERTLSMVPAGAAGFIATSLNEPSEGTGGTVNAKGEPVVTMMDFGREIFGNVVDVALFCMPSTSDIAGEDIPDFALSVSVNDPARSRAIWQLVLGMAKGATGGGSMEPKVKEVDGALIERYDIDGVGVYVVTDGNRMVFTPSRRALEAALAAGRGKNIYADPLFADAMKSFSGTETLAVAVSPGRAMQIASNYMSEWELREVGPFLPLLESTVAVASVEHSDTTLGLSARVTGLPKVGPMVSQLVRAELMGRHAYASDSVGILNAPSAPVAYEVAETAAHDPWTIEAEDAAEVSLREAFEELVASGQHDHAKKLIDPIVNEYGDNAFELNNFAWYLLTEDRYNGQFNDECLPIAKKANELSGYGNWYYLDTLSHALAAQGDLAKAIEVQRKAVAVANEQNDPRRGEAAEVLARFEKMASQEL